MDLKNVLFFLFLLGWGGVINFSLVQVHIWCRAQTILGVCAFNRVASFPMFTHPIVFQFKTTFCNSTWIACVTFNITNTHTQMPLFSSPLYSSTYIAKRTNYMYIHTLFYALHYGTQSMHECVCVCVCV